MTTLFNDRELRTNLIAKIILAAVTFALIAGWIQHSSTDHLTERSIWLAIGIVLGFALVGFQSHARRQLGLAVLASVLFAAASIWVVASDFRCMEGAGGLLFGFAAATLHGALTRAHLAVLPMSRFPGPFAVRVALILIACGAIYVAMQNTLLLTAPHAWWLVAAAGITTLWLCVIWHREALEQIIEVLIRPLYRIRGYGPGLKTVPKRGPLLVVANHAAWFDPLYLAKVLPRRLTPMMTSSFYDLPGLRWFMVHVFHAIRVQKSDYRREAPELQKAIDMLDRGGCVVIFPEGGMRRKEEAPLRRFGQGIWRILQARPNTPVAICWIEGNWGSFCSYYNGPPTKNKKLDCNRRIDVAMASPQTTPPAILEDHVTARRHFMQACLNARAILGLPVFPMPIILETEDDEANDSDAA